MQKSAVAPVVLAFAMLADPLAAAEYCVVCAGPEATYRCQVDGAGAREQDPRTQLLCISQLATAGQHDSCSVTRRSKGSDFGEDCPGEIRIIAAPALAPARANPEVAHPEVAPAGIPYEPGPNAPNPPSETTAVGEIPPSDEPAPPQVPQTVEELAGQTMKNSQDGLKKAGKAIGGTGEAIAGGAKETGQKIGAAGSAVGTAAKKTWNCLASLFKDC